VSAMGLLLFAVAKKLAASVNSRCVEPF